MADGEPAAADAIEASIVAHMPAPADGWRIRIDNYNGRDLETVERAKVHGGKPHPEYSWCKCARCRKARATVIEA